MIELEVNGKKVRLKEFPREALEGVILGFLGSLKLEEEPKEIKIYIRVDTRGAVSDVSRGSQR